MSEQDGKRARSAVAISDVWSEERRRGAREGEESRSQVVAKWLFTWAGGMHAMGERRVAFQLARAAQWYERGLPWVGAVVRWWAYRQMDREHWRDLAVMGAYGRLDQKTGRRLLQR